MTANLYLKNAKVVTEQEVFFGGIVVAGEKIAEVVKGSPEIAADQTIDVKGNLILPGIIDGHVHLNEPGREAWEGYATGTQAAAAGGITTLLDMPLNSTPPTINRAELKKKREVAAAKAYIDYAQWGGFVDNNLAELDDLNADGVIGFKAFASNSGVDFERLDDDMLYAGLKKMAELGNLIGLHAENEYVTRLLGEQMPRSGRTDRASWYESRPPFTELETVLRPATGPKSPAGTCILSMYPSRRAPRNCPRERRRRSCHFRDLPALLFFDEKDFEAIGPAAKCAPRCVHAQSSMNYGAV
jgi:allantoinase